MMLSSVSKLLDKLIVRDFISLNFVFVDSKELESEKQNIVIFRPLKGMRHVEVLAWHVRRSEISNS